MSNRSDFTIDKMYHVHPWWNESHWRGKYVPLIMEVKDKDAVITVFEFDFSKRDTWENTSFLIDGAYIKKPLDPWDNPWRIMSCNIQFAAWYYMFNVHPNTHYRDRMIPFDVTLDYDNNRLLMGNIKESLEWDLDHYVERIEAGKIDILTSNG